MPPPGARDLYMSAPPEPEPDLAEPVTDLRSVDNARVKARVVDLLLAWGAYYAVALLVSGPLELWHVLGLLWAEMTYFFVGEAIWGQTLGKRLCGIRVRRRDGGAPSLNQVAARNVIRIFEEPVIALIVLVGSRSRRQRVGDLVAGTIVTRSPAPVPAVSVRVLAYPVVWAAGAVLFGFSIGSDGRDGGASATASGYYPPAPSLATDMTAEWRTFADQVDRICAYNFNRAMAGQAQIESAMRGRPSNEIEAAIHYNWAAGQRATFRMVAGLGPPPAKPRLLERWRQNVRFRGELFKRGGDAWLHRNGAGDAAIHRRMDRLKLLANELGQRFGLRICTSNGPGRQPVDS